MQRVWNERLTLVLILASAALALPGQAAESPAVPDEAVLAELPFIDRDSANVWVNVSADPARPLEVMLDTSQGTSQLGAAKMRALGRRTRARVATPMGRSIRFLGGNLLPPDTAVVGHDFLRHYVLEIDYPARRVRFLDRGHYVTPESVDDPREAILPLRIRGGFPEVEIEIGGRPLHAVLDTAGTLGLLLEPEVARSAGFDPERWPVVGTLPALTGPRRIRLVEAENVRLGRFRFQGVPVAVFVSQARGFLRPPEVTLGPDMLRHFVVRYDPANRRVWLRLASDVTTFAGLPYGPGRRTGALLYQHKPGELGVIALIPGSRAHLRGVHTGDVFIPSAPDVERAFDEIQESLGMDEPVTVHRFAAGERRPLELGPPVGSRSSTAAD